MSNLIRSFRVTIRGEFKGFVNGYHFVEARRNARAIYGEYCDVDLCGTRKALRNEAIPCNQDQQRKTARRYPTDGFEARRAALIAAFQRGE